MAHHGSCIPCLTVSVDNLLHVHGSVRVLEADTNPHNLLLQAWQEQQKALILSPRTTAEPENSPILFLHGVGFGLVCSPPPSTLRANTPARSCFHTGLSRCSAAPMKQNLLELTPSAGFPHDIACPKALHCKYWPNDILRTS